MRIYDWSELSAEEKTDALARPAFDTAGEVEQTVKSILREILAQKDEALLYYRERYDHTPVNEPISLDNALIKAACERVSDDVKEALIQAKSNINLFHKNQNNHSVIIETSKGVQCEKHVRPLEKVGLYIPGGTAPLPSTVLMLGIPAALANCPEVILCSPPPLSDEIILAATLCGIDRLYAIGGAQAIAAMAFGTSSVTKVDKIFGPGNAYVTEAKRQVSLLPDGPAIDMPAGPSELLVIADESASPDFIAADLLSQAEHSTDAQVILVSSSRRLITDTIMAVNNQKGVLPRQKIITASLANSRFILCDSTAQGIEISNQYAPEHLSIQTEKPEKLVEHIKHAGSVFLGPWSPESAGDYASGTNHVLPTYGHARTCSSLGVADFVRYFTVQTLTASGLQHLGKTITTLARAEKLEAHAKAVDIRLDHLQQTEKGST